MKYPLTSYWSMKRRVVPLGTVHSLFQSPHSFRKFSPLFHSPHLKFPDRILQLLQAFLIRNIFLHIAKMRSKMGGEGGGNTVRMNIPVKNLRNFEKLFLKGWVLFPWSCFCHTALTRDVFYQLAPRQWNSKICFSGNVWTVLNIPCLSQEDNERCLRVEVFAPDSMN